MLELKQKRSAVQGNRFEQMPLMVELEDKLAVRDKMFARSCEERSDAQPGTGKRPPSGHGPREQKQLGIVERIHELDDADRVCTRCGDHYGSRSERDTEVAALFYSFVESAKLARVEPDANLRAAEQAAFRNQHVRIPHENQTHI